MRGVFTTSLAVVAAVAAGCQLFVDSDRFGGDSADSPDVDAGAESDADGDSGPGIDALIPTSLIDRGLLARYYIDEAGQGSDPTELLDSAPEPLALPINYTGGVEFAGAAGTRALSWPALELDGRAGLATRNTKLEDLLLGTTATVETVVDAKGAGLGKEPWSPIVQFGAHRAWGVMSLWVSNGTTVDLGYRDVPSSQWTVPELSNGRVVLHVVVDTSESNPLDRARMYVNGAPVASGGTPPALDSVIEKLVAGQLAFYIGNDVNGGNSLEGSIHYLGVYSVPLDDAEIAANAAFLNAGDDRP